MDGLMDGWMDGWINGANVGLHNDWRLDRYAVGK